MDLLIKKEFEKALIPSYGTEYSAGLDFAVYTEEDYYDLKPNEHHVFTTGIAMAIPEGFYLALYDRSSTGVKKHIVLSNGTGIIDSDYRGFIKVSLYNQGDTTIRINDGDKLVQGILRKIEKIECINVVLELPETKRGSGGFGSTGF